MVGIKAKVSQGFVHDQPLTIQAKDQGRRMTPSYLVTLLLALVGLFFGSAHAQYMMGMPMGMGMGGYGMMGGMGGMGMGGMGGMGMGGYPMMGGTGLFDGFGGDLGDDGFGESLRLTCLNNNTNSRGFLTDAIAVTIGYSDEGGFDGMSGGFGGFGFQGQRQRSPLKATVQLLSSAQGTGTIVFTKMARIEDGCSKFTMGGIHAPVQNNNQMGMGGFGGMGMGLGGMGIGMMGGFGGDNGAGILKEDIQINFNLQTIYIDSLDGFDDLGDLSGRGIAVCSDSSLGWDFEAECSGPMYACCALKYDNHDVSLGLDTFDDSFEDHDGYHDDNDGYNDHRRLNRISTVTYT